MSDSEDDSPQLSREALTALQEFYTQQAEKDKKLRCILEGKERLLQRIQFDEDWQLSQFWYDDETAEYLSREALKAAGPTGKIALISCPTLYKNLKSEAHNNQVTLFEFDKRFAIYGEDFILYDYNTPLDIPCHFAGNFDVVVVDPPFLSEECLTKTAVTVKFLAKHKIILCTGANMEELAKKLLDVRKCEFEPHHKNNLANEFYCYANYDIGIETK
ncbi:hypothetical protein Cfor_12677 [Coptotermes formosanus]|uniref:Protein-lysine N-methyltransferase Cfor_12677 n=1 Tax=Coptotermes formosanus TaxID=36987 RepID=A0A6L2Q114_COPFO|nr:hypothetical protein Cfor_12677 [Coptotermes formosanus]